jgi:hypothetical protein
MEALNVERQGTFGSRQKANPQSNASLSLLRQD